MMMMMMRVVGVVVSPPPFSPHLVVPFSLHTRHDRVGVVGCRAHSDSDSRETKAESSRVFDRFFFTLFRNKMVQEVGWDSDKPGYDGLIEVANRLMLNNSSNHTSQAAAVRILASLFPPLLLQLFRALVAPLAHGKLAALMVARATALSCQWLMGPCQLNSLHLPDGTSLDTGVFVERCKYLEESKCVGICIHTCKLPTQTFFKDYMGVPLTMEPNFSDYSCQFKFGITPPLPKDDKSLVEPCLEICPNAMRRRQLRPSADDFLQCPKS